MAEPIRLSLVVSPEMNRMIEDIAEKIHSNKSDVLRKAIALMALAVEAKEQGNRIGIADKDRHFVTEIVGI